MDDAVPLPESSLGGMLSDAAADLDLMDELFSGGVWLETPGCSDLLQPGTSTSTGAFDSSCISPLFEISNSSSNPIQPESDNHDGTERSLISVNPPSEETQIENFVGTPPLNPSAIEIARYSMESGELDMVDPSSEAGTSLWIQPRVNLGPVYSVNDRLIYALECIKESQRGCDVLVQIWVPVKMGDRQVLTTFGQPFSLDLNSQRLVNYRTVSMNYQFSAEENSNEVVGLPSRVFLGMLPEWTPDVRYFSSFEYPRVNHAQHYDVRGTIALPIFERDSRACLGVVEVVSTAQKINYSSDLENICNALQAVDLRTSEVLSIPHVKVSNDSYQAALPEIVEVVQAVCRTHRLPLAQTWIPCIQQDKGGRRHSYENYKDCISTVDAACYVNDPFILSFHEACSEHHLFRGQGVAGKAFTTNQPCFSSDITAISKAEYPLSHHAKMFHLRAAVAIRLRNIHTGIADFVLEFFLPIDCVGSDEQKLMLYSLSITIQQVCRNLRVVTAKELEDESMLPVSELIPSDVLLEKSDSEGGQKPNSDKGAPMAGVSGDVSSWTVQQNGEGSPLCMPLECRKQEVKGFSVATHCDHPDLVLPAGRMFAEFKQNHQDLVKETADHKDSFSGEPGFSNALKAKEKRRAKAEKTVSVQVLRQYFAGSLKDAAKSIGVCPTTLKRICRQHGITRWPSRKIKKVDHSLKKLQVVIDSVQGAEGAIQLSSLYANFTKASGSDKKLLGTSTFSTLKEKDDPSTSNAHRQQEEAFGSHTSASNSFSSCSQSSSSSPCCSSGAMQSTHAAQLVIKQEASMEEKQSGLLKRAHSEVDLHLPTQAALRCLTRSHSHKSLSKRPSLGSLSHLHKNKGNLLGVKAMYGEEKVRFRLQPTWGFQDLKQEIAKRFNISNVSSIDLKYLDDDCEWVLLTCDADLQECIDVYKSSCAHTVKICVHHASHPSTRTSLGSTGFS